MTSDEPFVAHRGLLFTVAYELLGSASDAEDAVQETWLRWHHLGEARRADVRDPRAYLVRVVARESIDRMRAIKRRKEVYVGEWLPEPVLTSPDVADDVELAESVSIAMLMVLETLTPLERAVFVLREVFDTPYDEIARALDKSQPAVRQIAHRAREHVAARRPRVEVDRRKQREATDRFVAALTTGDLQGLMDVLAPDVVMIADSGGFAAAVRRPVAGAERVASLLRRVARFADQMSFSSVWINGAPALRVDGPPPIGTTVISLDLDGDRISRIFSMRNPHKLVGLSDEAVLGR